MADDVSQRPRHGTIAAIKRQILAGDYAAAADALSALDPASVAPYLHALTRAQLAEAAGNRLDELTYAAAAYAAAPDRPVCYGAYAMALERAGQPAFADAIIAQAVETEPKKARPRYWRARLAAKRQDYDAAISDLSWALKRAPKEDGIRRARLDLLLETRGFVAARGDLLILQETAPDQIALYRTGQEIAQALADPAFGLAQSAALVSRVSDLEDLRRHVDWLLAAEAHEAILPFLRAVASDEPRLAGWCAKAAVTLERNGRPDDALKAMDIAIRASGQPKLKVSKALMQRRMGRSRSAERLLRATLRTTPGELRAAQQLTKLLLEEDRPQAALRIVSQMRDAAPDDATLMLYRARALADLGRLSEAEALLKRLQPRDDLEIETVLALAKFFAQLGLRKQEFDVLQAAIGRAPLHRPLLEFALRRLIDYVPRGVAEPRMKRLETLLQSRFSRELWLWLYMKSFDFEAAIEKSRGEGRRGVKAAIDLARILIGSHRYETAFRYLRFCHRRWPTHAGFVTTAFETMVRFGRIAEARKLSEETVDLPGLPVEWMQMTLALYDVPGQRLDLLEDAAGLRRLPVKGVEILLRNTLATADLVSGEILHKVLQDKNARSIERSWWSSYLGQIVMELQLLARDLGVTAPEDLVLPEDFADLREMMREKSWSTVLGAAVITRAVADGSLTRPPAVPQPEAGPIPKVIHQYWDASPPEAVLELTESWASAPGYAHQLFDKAAALTFLRSECGPRWVQAFRLARRAEEEADFLRLALLSRRGGIWADADDLLYGAVDRLIPPGPGLVVFREPAANAISTNFIAARPGHPVIQAAEAWVMQGLLQRSNEKLWLKSGPGMMTRAVAWYIAEAGPEQAARELLLPGQEVLRRDVSIHNPLEHKITDKYWNAKLRRDPGYLALFDSLIAAEGGAEPTAA